MINKIKLNKENAFIIILAGILCMVIVWPEPNDSAKQTDSEQFAGSTMINDRNDFNTTEQTLVVYIENQEKRLTDILSQMEGVGDVQVMIRASASKEYVVEKDVTLSNNSILETDSEGGTRQSNETNRSELSIYTKDSSGKDIPWVIKEMEPEIEGVLVAAVGGDQEQVAQEITQAVQVLFDIPVHKIKVVKMKGK